MKFFVTMANNDIFLFKLNVLIQEKEPRPVKYRITFLDIPPFQSSKQITFPMTLEDLTNFESPKILITATQNEQFHGSAVIDASNLIETLTQELEPENHHGKKLITENVNLLGENQAKLYEFDVNVELSCMGRSIIEDADNQKPQPQETKKYDEYSAQVNGHSLNIKMLKKQKKNEDHCSCDSKISHKKTEIVQNREHLVFKMPSDAAMCKNIPKGFQYNVAHCEDWKTHGHGPETIAVSQGNMNSSPITSDDSFLIKIGKNGNSGEGRLEIELKAPKPLSAEDFKPQTRNQSVQTQKFKEKIEHKDERRKTGFKIKKN